MATDSLTLDVSPDDIPVNAIPCLTSLGATYNVLTGLYADARSCKQIVINSSIMSLLRPAFQKALDETDPIAIFEQYGTHVVNSITAGGRASFTFAVMYARKCSASESVGVAASLCQIPFLMGQLSAEELAEYAETISDFQTSRTQRVLTQDGAPQYGNDSFLTHITEWARSVQDYTAYVLKLCCAAFPRIHAAASIKMNRFIDFGKMPAFVSLRQLASTASRQNVLKVARTCVSLL
ncbi:hypothetical protein A0H81_06196 [Grifola frondosa]|uniref:MACPF domain-containing protein n=1 Tax=Grifola frondosa TaxID=5627 RepID=A0A1C7MAG3_GRIFR|nr:hypothetical protein A0H81_06196 [Grifola frondosa]